MPEVSETNPCNQEEVNLCPKCGAHRVRKLCYTKPDGSKYYGWRCHPCRIQESHEFKERHRDRLREIRLAKYAANPEKFREERKDYYRRNTQAAADYQRHYVKHNRDKVKTLKREWYRTEKGKASNRETKRQWRLKYPDRAKNMARNYLTSEAGKRNHEQAGHRRRARKAAAACTATRAELLVLRSSMKECYYCGSSHKLTVDHVAPLALLGPHSIENLVMACKTCNSKKTYLTPEKWAEKSGMHIFPMEERFYYLPFPKAE